MAELKKESRFLPIDLLRGFSMIVVILTHTTVYYLSNKGVSIFWNYIHFAVPIFVFCSGYILLNKHQHISSFSEFIFFLKKRLSRLLIPFYIYLIFFFILQFLTHTFSLINIPKGVFVLYPDISWLILLFVELTLLYPFLAWLIQRRIAILLWLGFAGLITILLLVVKIPIDYRYIMVVPWTIPFLLGNIFKNIENKKYLVLIFAGYFGTLFLTQHVLLQGSTQDMLLQHNKYPPNSYYMSYGLFWLSVLYLIFNIPFIQKKLSRVLSFFSLNSYSLFFIHYFILQVIFLQKWIHFNVWSLSIVVLMLSIFIQIILNLYDRKGVRT